MDSKKQEVVSSSEFRRHIAEYVDAAIGGRKIIVTRWKRPVVILQAFEQEQERGSDETTE